MSSLILALACVAFAIVLSRLIAQQRTGIGMAGSSAGRTHFSLCILSLLISARCVAQPKPSGHEIQNVSYCQLIAEPRVFDGQRVRLRTILVLGFEINHLEPPDCCPAGNDRMFVTTGEDLDRRSRRIFRKSEHSGISLVVVSGIFENRGPYGPSANRFQLVVEKFEKVERHGGSLHERPDWARKSCQGAEL